MPFPTKVVVILVSVLLSVVGASFLHPSVTSSTTECVTNGGFETGTFTGWQYANSFNYHTYVISTDSHSGTYCAQLGQVIQTFTNPIATSDVKSAGFWYKAHMGGLEWYIEYSDGTYSALSASSASAWTYIDWMPYLTAGGSGNYFGSGGSGKQILAIDADNTNLGATVLVDDFSIQATAIPPTTPLSVSIKPTAVLMNVSQSQLFSSTVSGGTSPYSYQWYFNNVPVSGATSSKWTFTASSAGFPTVYLIVTDSQSRTTKSNTVAVTINNLVSPSYTLSLTIEDQVSNPLPATVKVGVTSVTCNSTGKIQLPVSSGTQTISASIQIGATVYSTSKTVSVTSDTTLTLTITRRFYWQFYINYTDGSLAVGTLSGVSSKETLTAQVSKGYTTMYPFDGQYTFSFSDPITLQTVNINKDGTLRSTINNQTKSSNTTTTTTTNQTSVTPPLSSLINIFGLMVPLDYLIYGSFAFIAIVAIVTAVVIHRRHRKMP